MSVRISCGRFVNNVTQHVSVTYIGSRNISGKTMRVKAPAPKPAPWPYKTNRYTMLHRFFDRTSARLDENSKLIVVEGPVAAGKSKFAQELADELEMLYFPEANLDMIFTNEYGYDLKQLDPQLPETCRSFDLLQYTVKYSQYIDALAHILSTGQGVVLDRCVYSDFVFAEAMCSKGYISREVRSLYYELRKNSIGELLRPHLVIYLDVPVNKCLENIQKRNISYEKNSPDISYSAELLVYDWSHEGEVEVIVEDIERINFNRYDEQDPKFVDWRYSREEMFAYLRNKYSDGKNFLMTYLNVPRFNIPELLIEAEDAKLALEIYDNAPGNEYAPGYNSSMGDTSILFKSKLPLRETLPVIERRAR
ncbi:Deoxynucleoside kinase [Popillia japonica]|uniref:NADH dehydrogenase [ubiquinone] 1 alpha subcomplex subunit 10, mitochondrial n=1 Tax=Popillia japonica TaxID=7064 RepID=A0AAW1K1L8_POPJA